jgi:DedD protein
MAGRDRGRPARDRRGLWGALFSLTLLAGVAFVVGALAGLVWKEPGLLFAHLTGRTSEVAWGVEDPAVVAARESPPAVSAPALVETPPPAAERKPAAPPPPAAKPRPPASVQAPAVAAAPPAAPGARIAIQVGAFAQRSSAELLRDELRKGGFPSYVAAGAATGSPRWRVRVGPYASRADADRIAAQLKSARSLPTWVLDEDAP